VQRIYAHCDSEGLDTNLQLYAIRQAAREWKNLCALRRRHGKNQVPEEKERLVFVLVCLGLSLSQLLGQQSSAKNLPPPKKLLDEVLSGSSVNETERCQLRDKFADLVTYYDASRHFGKSKHSIIDRLTFDKVDKFVDTTLEVWNLVITRYRSDRRHNIDEYFSIAEEVDLAQLQERNRLERQLRDLQSGRGMVLSDKWPQTPSDRTKQIAQVKEQIAQIDDELISRNARNETEA
jgi:hypothetical protein